MYLPKLPEGFAGSRASAAVDAPIRHERIGGADTPIPSGRDLERAALPQVEDIVSRVLECF